LPIVTGNCPFQIVKVAACPCNRSECLDLISR
jgi:hypothetical protein